MKTVRVQCRGTEDQRILESFWLWAFPCMLRHVYSRIISLACSFFECLSTLKKSKLNINTFERYDYYRILKSKRILGNGKSCLLKSNRMCLFLSFMSIYIQKIKLRCESIRSRDIDDYRIIMCSWHCAQLQLQLKLLFHFWKKKINAQKLIRNFLIFEEHTPKWS